MNKFTNSELPSDFQQISAAHLGSLSDLKETHLSNVLLGKNFCLKFKKSVNLGFVDYSSFEQRSHCAAEEILLNRRLTEGVYLGLAYFSRASDGRYLWCQSFIQPPAEPPRGCDEVAVVMKTLPQENFLSARLRSGNLPKEEFIPELAKRLGSFAIGNRQAPPDPRAYVAATRASMQDNFNTLLSSAVSSALTEDRLRIIRLCLTHFEVTFTRYESTLIRRALEGKVLDGHGDLRLEHICLEGSEQHPLFQIYDCLEFSSALRLNDPASEFGFLCMDFERYYRPDLSKKLAFAIAQQLDDQELLQLLPLFISYRAMVRAKVHAIRLHQLSDSPLNAPTEQIEQSKLKFDDYIGIAARIALGLRGPLLVLMHGLMGSGKSTVAGVLEVLVHAKTYSSDLIRAKLWPTRSYDEGFGKGKYSAEGVDQVYKAMLEQAAVYLACGNVIILDASFIYRRHRTSAIELANSIKVPVVLIKCSLARDKLISRLETRFRSGTNLSEGRPKLLQEQEISAENPAASEGFDAILEIDTANPVQEQLIKMLGQLSKELHLTSSTGQGASIDNL